MGPRRQNAFAFGDVARKPSPANDPASSTHVPATTREGKTSPPPTRFEGKSGKTQLQGPEEQKPARQRRRARAGPGRAISKAYSSRRQAAICSRGVKAGRAGADARHGAQRHRASDRRLRLERPARRASAKNDARKLTRVEASSTGRQGKSWRRKPAEP